MPLPCGKRVLMPKLAVAKSQLLKTQDIFFKSHYKSNKRYSLLSFGGPHLYNSEALSFTNGQYVVIELADKLCYCLFLCFAKVCLSHRS